MDFSNMTNLRELLAAGGPILILLLLLSVYSISIILERFFKLRSTAATRSARKITKRWRTPAARKSSKIRLRPRLFCVWCRNVTARKQNWKKLRTA